MGEKKASQCSLETNVDYFQPNNPSFPVENAEACCDLCYNNDECYYYTFYQGNCYIKQTDEGRVNSEGRISGSVLARNYTKLVFASGDK